MTKPEKYIAEEVFGEERAAGLSVFGEAFVADEDLRFFVVKMRQIGHTLSTPDPRVLVRTPAVKRKTHGRVCRKHKTPDCRAVVCRSA